MDENNKNLLDFQEMILDSFRIKQSEPSDNLYKIFTELSCKMDTLNE